MLIDKKFTKWNKYFVIGKADIMCVGIINIDSTREIGGTRRVLIRISKRRNKFIKDKKIGTLKYKCRSFKKYLIL
jgi:hypothetical protein